MAGTGPRAPGGRVYRLLGADRRPYPSATPGRLGGHRRTRIYGRLDCPAARRAIAAGGYLRSRVFFADGRGRGGLPALRRLPARRVRGLESGPQRRGAK